MFSLLNDHSPQQEQYRFLYHTVAQLFSRTLQNTSPHRQKLKEVQSPQFHSVSHQHSDTPENNNGLTVPGPSPPQDYFLSLSPHKLISAPTVTSRRSMALTNLSACSPVELCPNWKGFLVPQDLPRAVCHIPPTRWCSQVLVLADPHTVHSASGLPTPAF